jgi:hypothetical protein
LSDGKHKILKTISVNITPVNDETPTLSKWAAWESSFLMSTKFCDTRSTERCQAPTDPIFYDCPASQASGVARAEARKIAETVSP